MKVSDVMSTEVISVGRAAPVREAATLLATHRISGLPVVDDDGTVVGVFSEADVIAREAGNSEHAGLLHWVLSDHDPQTLRVNARTTGDAMASPAITIRPDRPLRDAARRMIEDGVRRLPVVDENGLLVGIVSRGDLVRAFTRDDAEIRAEIEDDVLRQSMWLEPGAVTVEVEGGIVTVGGVVSSDAEAEMIPRFIRRVPGVVDVVGSVTSRNR